MKELKKVKRLIKPIKIRWFSLYSAIIRIKEIFSPLVKSLESISEYDANALGVLNSMQTFHFCFYLNFLCDILGVLNILNKAFQKQDLTLGRVYILVNNIKKQITSDFCDISKLESNENLKLFIKEFEQKGTFQGIYMYVKLIISIANSD